MRRGVAPISVAISTRDRLAALRCCLDSLKAGALLPAEVVVSDQSVGPKTRDAVERLTSRELPIRYVRARPGGLGAAQNDAVAATTSSVVAVLDDDCVADRGWIATLAHAFSDPTLAFVSGRVLPLGPGQPGTYAVASRTSTKRLELNAATLPWDAGSGNNFAFRREWFNRIGGCDERLGPGSPGRGGLDMDLFRRLLRAGARGRYEPEALVLHERTSRGGRLARRFPYGYGMGACCMLWLKQGDREALRVLHRWLAMRSGRLGYSLVHLDWLAIHEELLVLSGTAGAIVFGLRASRRA